MKTSDLIFATIAAVAILFTHSAPAQAEDKSASSDAAYTQAIEKRTADIMAALALKDDAKAAAVHDAIIAQYRALHDWQAANEARLKDLAKQKDDDAKAETAKIMVARKALHDPFLAKLSAQVNPEQVELVKDKLTYGKVQFTYQGYLVADPNLTDAQKAKILEMLKQAREEAIDGCSSDEKTAIFKKYKGKINNYLSAEKKASAQAQPSPSAVPPK
jgi:hypothetical protein